MTKEPADWAKIKAYRFACPDTKFDDADILQHWVNCSDLVHELARLYDRSEQPPVDPDLVAAREWCEEAWPGLAVRAYGGVWDGSSEVKTFLAGIKHGRANP